MRSWPVLLLAFLIAACGSESEAPGRCGNGALDAGEACDEGADNSDTAPDACRTDCRTARCGDGAIDAGEGCDDGAGNGEGGPCRIDCVPLTCGDGVVDDGERCDEGAANSDTRPDACRTRCRPAACGDGVVDAGEACDDGETNSDTAPDACRTDCRTAGCGDGVVDAGEGCDDGPANSDGVPGACRSSCRPASCGDGVVDAGETCDDGAANSDSRPDGCRSDCRWARCGDGALDTGEACDDGEDNSAVVPDACRLDCRLAACGDDVVDADETCDEGAANSDVVPDACRTDCRAPRCGDGVRDATEACDHGPDNDDTRADACRTSCVRAACGDGVTDRGEGCDDGTANSDTRPGACRTACVPAACGDGTKDPGEACDDGAGNSDTRAGACRVACAAPRCGDGVVDPGEACDEGSGNSDTRVGACRVACTAPRCGDGVVDPGEACDGGLANSDTRPGACRRTCAAASCGDGVVDPGEACDAGLANNDSTPGSCRTSCVAAHCGDGVADPGEGCDDGAGNSDGAPGACRNGCVPARCGDRVVDPGEGCDDGNFLPHDGCNASCGLEASVCGDGAVQGTERCDDGNRIDGDGCDARCGWSSPLACGTLAGTGPIDLQAQGTPVGTGAFTYTGSTSGWLDRTAATCSGAFEKGEQLFFYVPPFAGAVIVETETPGTGTSANLHLAARTSCDDPESEVACGPATATYLADRLLVPEWSPADGPLFLLLETTSVNASPYTLTVRTVPPLPLGASCVVEGWTGVCTGASAGTAICLDSDTHDTFPGTCVPQVPAGGSCDPAGLASVCVPRHSCEGGVCVADCGDGTTVWPETCDDGNLVDGDGCSSTCVREGLTCDLPFDLNAGWNPATRETIWSDRTTAGTSRVHTACAVGSASGPELIGQFTAPESGRYGFTLTPQYSSYDAALYLANRSCAVGSPVLGCAAGGVFVTDLAAGWTVFPVVDGLGTYEYGNFTLKAEQVICGDGKLGPSENCEDGNAVSLDGCSWECRREGGDCGTPYQLAWDPATRTARWTDTLATAQAIGQSECTVPGYSTNYNLDLVAEFVAPETGSYSFFVRPDDDWSAGVSVWRATGCLDSNWKLTCDTSDWTSTTWLGASLTAGTRYQILVEGRSAAGAGEFELLVRKRVCGDGLIAPPWEECDDGNTVAGDGCSGSCQAEPLFLPEPNDIPSAATPLPAGRWWKGRVTTTDPDWFSFTAIAGTTYTFDVYAGRIYECTGNATRAQLTLLDGAGATLATDVDGNFGNCPRLVWTAPASGPYYLGLTHADTSSYYIDYFLRLMAGPH